MTPEEIQQITQLITGAISPIATQVQGITSTLETLRTTPPVTPPAAPPAAPPATPPAAPPAAPAVSPELNSQLLDMRRSNEKLVQDMKALQDKSAADAKRADDAERMSVVNTALAPFQFANDAARQTAVEKIMPQVKRTDTGALVAGDNLTPEAFIKDFLPTQHAYLLAPVNASGAGVTPGTPGRPGSSAVDFDSIKPGMTPEAKAAGWAAVVAALPR